MFLESGYIDFNYVMNRKYIFNILIGGRGIGKTYGAIKWCIENKKKFIFMRRTQTQLDMVGNGALSPFKSISIDMGVDIVVKPIAKSVYGAYVEGSEKPFSYLMALSTISNLRGFDASDVEYIIFDEFIKEKHERPIKFEAEAFFNAYETINRNRELKGQPAIRVIMLSNSIDIANDLFISLGIVTKFLKNIKKGNQAFVDDNRSLIVYNITKSDISSAKKETALYKLTSGSQFEKFSLENEYTSDNEKNVKSKNLKEYRLYLIIGELSVYKHKSNGEYYISTHTSGSTTRKYDIDALDLMNFKMKHRDLIFKLIIGDVISEDYLCEVLLKKYLDIK